MSRPTLDPSQLQSGSEAWDAFLRDILSSLAVTPSPVPQYANAAALPAASSYDRCLACTIDTNKLWFSNGTIWKEVSFV